MHSYSETVTSMGLNLSLLILGVVLIGGLLIPVDSTYAQGNVILEIRIFKGKYTYAVRAFSRFVVMPIILLV